MAALEVLDDLPIDQMSRNMTISYKDSLNNAIAMKESAHQFEDIFYALPTNIMVEGCSSISKKEWVWLRYFHFCTDRLDSNQMDQIWAAAASPVEHC